jgi:hypothetical protein
MLSVGTKSPAWLKTAYREAGSSDLLPPRTQDMTGNGLKYSNETFDVEGMYLLLETNSLYSGRRF